jgi:hypothetical protein
LNKNPCSSLNLKNIYKGKILWEKEVNVMTLMIFYVTSLVFVMQVVAIRDIIPPPQRESFNDVYIAYELMDTDLHQIIRSNQVLSEEHCQVSIKYLLC